MGRKIPKHKKTNYFVYFRVLISIAVFFTKPASFSEWQSCSQAEKKCRQHIPPRWHKGVHRPCFQRLPFVWGGEGGNKPKHKKTWHFIGFGSQLKCFNRLIYTVLNAFLSWEIFEGMIVCANQLYFPTVISQEKILLKKERLVKAQLIGLETV